MIASKDNGHEQLLREITCPILIWDAGPRSGLDFWSKILDHNGVAYAVEVTSAAARQIVKLPQSERPKIWQKINALADNPRPPGVEKLSGAKDAYRIRVGNYRIVYTVDDSVTVVTVTRVAHRREVYRRK